MTFIFLFILFYLQFTFWCPSHSPLFFLILLLHIPFCFRHILLSFPTFNCNLLNSLLPVFFFFFYHSKSSFNHLRVFIQFCFPIFFPNISLFPNYIFTCHAKFLLFLFFLLDSHLLSLFFFFHPVSHHFSSFLSS